MSFKWKQVWIFHFHAQGLYKFWLFVTQDIVIIIFWINLLTSLETNVFNVKKSFLWMFKTNQIRKKTIDFASLRQLLGMLTFKIHASSLISKHSLFSVLITVHLWKYEITNASFFYRNTTCRKSWLIITRGVDSFPEICLSHEINLNLLVKVKSWQPEVSTLNWIGDSRKYSMRHRKHVTYIFSLQVCISLFVWYRWRNGIIN